MYIVHTCIICALHFLPAKKQEEVNTHGTYAFFKCIFFFKFYNVKKVEKKMFNTLFMLKEFQFKKKNLQQSNMQRDCITLSTTFFDFFYF